jgi:hypothetical protein
MMPAKIGAAAEVPPERDSSPSTTTAILRIMMSEIVF